jgi:hypothetical protein
MLLCREKRTESNGVMGEARCLWHFNHGGKLAAMESVLGIFQKWRLDIMELWRME